MAKGTTGLRILVEGVARARADVADPGRRHPGVAALSAPLSRATERSIEVDAHVRRLQELIEKALSLATGLSQDLRRSSQHRRSAAARVPPGELLDMKPEDKQLLLEEDDLRVKLERRRRRR